MTDQQSHVLARLKRCEVWTERSKSQGYISLEGLRRGHWCREELPEDTLNELVAAGLADVSTSVRIVENPNYANWRPHEVTQKYWKALDK